MQTCRFSPIQTEEDLLKAVVYVAETSSALCKKITGEVFPIVSLTVFAHSDSEYAFLKTVLFTLGDHVGDIYGPRVMLHTPIHAGGHTITHLRIREPALNHPQVGSNDYVIQSYTEFKEKYLTENQKNLRLIERPGYELIEFFDPSIDVLGYVLSDPARSTK